MPSLTDNNSFQSLIGTDQLELDTLVGHYVYLYSEQFPGIPLKARVVEYRDNALTVDRSGGKRRVDSLVHNQQLGVQFAYKGERITLRARFKREGSKCRLIIGPRAVALTRRRFVRVDMSLDARLAVLPVTHLAPSRLKNLRWIQTDTANFSSGGVLIGLSSYLERNTVLLMNIEQETFNFPALITGRVRYCHQVSAGRFAAGVEFIVTEIKLSLFPESTVRALPSVVFEYDEQKRLWLNDQIAAWTQQHQPEEPDRSSE